MEMPDRIARIREIYGEAISLAPALKRRFMDAGLRPDEIRDVSSLSKLPVLKKERLMEEQQADPPFAGYLACQPHELGHIYVSPGPIFEPSLGTDRSGHGMDRMFISAGIGPADLALNTWSYHLVPAGLLFDQGLRAAGATVIPGGTGASELQAELMIKLKPTVFLGSTAHFFTIVEKLEASGHLLPQAWALRTAFLGGEFGDWSAKRHHIEQRYALKTWSCYATADFGLIGYEKADVSGYLIHPDRFVQICDPDTGNPLPPGTPGEIVVTTLSRGWPMIRFGTGDVSVAEEIAPDGGASRIAPLQGRVGAAVKAREIFIYPGHVDRLRHDVTGIERMSIVVSRPNTREEITARILLASDALPDQTIAQLRARFPSVTRLQLDHVEIVADAALMGNGPPVVDNKQLNNPLVSGPSSVKH